METFFEKEQRNLFPTSTYSPFFLGWPTSKNPVTNSMSRIISYSCNNQSLPKVPFNRFPSQEHEKAKPNN